MKELLLILVSSAIVNNVVLSQFLGLCPFFGVSKRIETAAGMGGAIIFLCNRSDLQLHPGTDTYGIFTDDRIYPYHRSTCPVC